MGSKNKTVTELSQELDSMRQHQTSLEECRIILKYEHKKYSELLESSPDAIVFVDQEARITRVNAQFEKLFDYQPNELNGKSLDILIPKQFRKKHQDFVAEFYKNPRKRPMGNSYEIHGVKKNGDIFPADISLSHLEIDGKIYASAAVRDITERRQAEEKITRDYHIQRAISSVLKISMEPLSLDEHLQGILDLILSIQQLALDEKGGIYLIDQKDGHLHLKASKGFPERGTLPCRKVPFGKCLCGRAVRDCKIIYADCIDERHDIVYDGLFPHGHYCVPILEESEAVGLINVFVREGHMRNGAEEKFLTVIAHTLASVIRHHRIDGERNKLLEKLADSEKLAALGRLTTNFSHEIRNPLTAVGGLARRLAKSVPQDSEGFKYTSHIMNEVKRLEDLLMNMVAYSRSYTLPQQKHDLREIIKSLLFGFSERCSQQSITIKTSFEDIPMAQVDRELIEKMLENIISNGVEAMPEGGILTVSTVFRHISMGDFIGITIKDTGVGIPTEKLPVVFEPLFTTKTVTTRPGLGLASTKKIIESYGGTISVQSRQGEGTEFTITLPVEKS